MGRKLAKRKWKSRQRAKEHRAKNAKERAKQSVAVQERWQEHIENKDREKYDRNGGTFDGDRPDLEPDMVSKPFTRDELRMFKQDEDEELPEVKPRSKKKPPWMNRRGPQAKQNHLAKSKDRLKKIKKGQDKRDQPQQSRWRPKRDQWEDWDDRRSWEKAAWKEDGHESRQWKNWRSWDRDTSRPSSSTCAPVTDTSKGTTKCAAGQEERSRL